MAVGGADLHTADLAEAQREHGDTVPRVLRLIDRARLDEAARRRTDGRADQLTRP